MARRRELGETETIQNSCRCQPLRVPDDCPHWGFLVRHQVRLGQSVQAMEVVWVCRRSLGLKVMPVVVALLPREASGPVRPVVCWQVKWV